ncbi:ParE toxin of type II toxin-antitoxin system, parDE [uncultured archaeon]|nr:ParE toxin of type II toxin-antitoxin system, parDE [uncultured archaeon]
MGMKYKLLLSHKFDKDFSRLEKTLQERVVESLRELNENPHAGKQLKGKLKNLLSWRVGKYRILYQIHEEKLLVFAISVHHRKHVYD